MSEKVVETIPLWLAVVITVIIAMPFGLYLGNFNLPLWLSFIVWAEYFALGAKPAALKLIIPSFPLGAIWVGLWLTIAQPVMDALSGVVDPLTAAFIGIGLVGNFIFVGLGCVYTIRFSQTLQNGTLALFNGLSMALAVYFTRSFPQGIAVDPYSTIWLAVIWTMIAGWFGAFLGWFNVTITFPRKVIKK